MKDLEVQVLLDAEVQVAYHTAHKDKNHQHWEQTIGPPHTQQQTRLVFH